MVPGVVFVAFVACGWARVSLARFTVASLLVSALYLPLMLYLVIVFGEALDDHVGLWTWPLLFVALIVAGFVRAAGVRVPSGRHEGRGRPRPAPVAACRRAAIAACRRSARCRARWRSPSGFRRRCSICRWCSTGSRLGLRHRSLTLPSAANPNIPTGGMWGESKSACLDGVAPEQRALGRRFRHA